jgi:hypothetical protein
MCIMFKYRARFFGMSGKDLPDYTLTFLVRRYFTYRGEFLDAFATPVYASKSCFRPGPVRPR